MDARLLRLSLRLTQADLAAKAHTSQTSVSAFERGIRPISPALVQRILGVLVTEGARQADTPKISILGKVNGSQINRGD